MAKFNRTIEPGTLTVVCLNDENWFTNERLSRIQGHIKDAGVKDEISHCLISGNVCTFFVCPRTRQDDLIYEAILMIDKEDRFRKARVASTDSFTRGSIERDTKFINEQLGYNRFLVEHYGVHGLSIMWDLEDAK